MGKKGAYLNSSTDSGSKSFFGNDAAKRKANVGISLVVAFAVAVITGVMLHLKSHGIIIQPRSVLKIVHWILGYAMAALLCIHWTQFRRMLEALKVKFRWFYADTWILTVLFIATFLTGTVKLLTPVKIPHLGLWHYGIGLAMSATAAVHLMPGIPALRRLRRKAQF